jgi:hypothetical protein
MLMPTAAAVNQIQGSPDLIHAATLDPC